MCHRFNAARYCPPSEREAALLADREEAAEREQELKQVLERTKELVKDENFGWGVIATQQRERAVAAERQLDEAIRDAEAWASKFWAAERQVEELRKELQVAANTLDFIAMNTACANGLHEVATDAVYDIEVALSALTGSVSGDDGVVRGGGKP